MRRICCRATSSRNPPRGVTSPRICRISWPASRPGAARRRNGWKRKRTQTSGRCLASTLTASDFLEVGIFNALQDLLIQQV
jgi:hypothetical protein